MCAMTIDNTAGYGIYNLGFGLNGSSSSSSSSSTSSAYGGGVASLSTSALRAQIDKLLADVPRGDDGKLSFADVTAYRDQLQEEFEARAKKDLDDLGVDTDRDFSLSYDSNTGRVTVDSSHPDKEVIDKYFKDNPEMCDAFGKIVTLSKLSATAENKLSPTDFKRQMQTQAMAWWSEENGNSSWFSGGGMMLSPEGMSLLAGLNMKV